LALLVLSGFVAWPQEQAAQPKLDHWAFKPAVHPMVPAVKNRDWPHRPIDNFVLARLEAEKLAPSQPADRLTLIRRLSFDLIGLPPTPEEVWKFVSDTGPDAYERLVDRLLASPRYGERWARHWLDVVHYGESHGYDKDKPRTNAWAYRDYVIRSLNNDTPYTRFVQEQLAGDVLFPDVPDGVIATGFIAAGPWDYVGHVELSEGKTDGLIARYNDRDDMVMNTMSTFLSLTVHCARCHDHKFDPISQVEYYGLQAVFAGVDRADRPFDLDPQVAAERRTLMAERKGLVTRQKELNECVAKATNPQIEQIGTRLKELKEQLNALPKPDKESPSNGYHSGIEPTPDVDKWVQVDLGQVRPIDEVRLVPARPTDFPDTPGFGFPRRFRVEAAKTDNFSDRSVLADHTKGDFPNPADNPAVIPAKDCSARFIRVTATRLWERTHDFVFALAELQVFSGTNNVTAGANVTALDSIEGGRWGRAKLVDNFDSRKLLTDPPEAPEVRIKRNELKAEIDTLEEDRANKVQALLDAATKSEIIEVRNRIAQVNREVDVLPKPQWVYAAADDFAPTGSFLPSGTPRPIHLLKRGDVKRPGPLMAPAALNCIPGLAGDLPMIEPKDEGSRRAALARWVTDSRNMLTRRSIVNRVWQYHFGRGIVDTPNDFGHMGSLPTHPELLDWLAYWFLENGESLKKLHRLIVTSATYRQSSSPVGSDVKRLTSNSSADHQLGAQVSETGLRAASVFSAQQPAGSASHQESQSLLTSAATAGQIDSDNRLLWHMNRQRLDAESFHDALLFLSGRLDFAMGGPSARQFFFKDDHSPVYDYTRFDVDSPESSRPSIYRFIVRSVPDPFMETLDCPDANLLAPKRNITLTALQALSTLNNPFVLRQCERFAARLQGQSADLSEEIDLAYRLALSRRPHPHEAALLRAYAQKHGLPNACRLLVNSSEFVFID
jgi:hypothetical protein